MIDRYYIDRILPYFENSKVLSNSPLKIQCRCILCGDSQTNKRKMRGYFLERREDPGNITYICHNCGAGHSMWGLLHLRFPELLSQYRLDKFRPATFKANRKDDLESFQSKLPTPKPQVEDSSLSWIPVTSLEDSSIVRRYLKMRGVVDLEDFYFTDKFRQLANEVSFDPPFSVGALFYDHPRIVTRIMKDGCLQGIIGRSIRKEDVPRYLIIKASVDASMVFNYDKVDLDDQVFIAEGVYDSAILSNSVGLLGLSKREDMLHIPNRVWCLDNQPRSPDVVKNYQQLINQGESVVLWDKLPPNLQQHKDLNSMFMKGGASKKFLDEYVRNNVVSGQVALLQFSRWAKVEKRGRRIDASRLSTIDAFKTKFMNRGHLQ